MNARNGYPQIPAPALEVSEGGQTSELLIGTSRHLPAIGSLGLRDVRSGSRGFESSEEWGSYTLTQK